MNKSPSAVFGLMQHVSEWYHIAILLVSSRQTNKKVKNVFGRSGARVRVEVGSAR